MKENVEMLLHFLTVFFDSNQKETTKLLKLKGAGTKGNLISHQENLRKTYYVLFGKLNKP